MLTRSYLIDITLVGLASFTLLCVLGQTLEQGSSGPANRQAYAVTITQPNGQRTTYRVNETRQTADQLREDLVQQMSVRRTPDVAWMQWYRETAELYAADCTSRGQSVAARDSASETVFRAVSTGLQKSTGLQETDLQSSNGNPGAATPLTRWRDFWMDRQAKATSWLTEYEQQNLARRAAINASIQITPTRSWLPSPTMSAKAAMIATLVMLLGLVWRAVFPPRSFFLSRSSRGMLSASTNENAATGNTAAMCFRESWVRMRQPASVVLRGLAGWGIVLSSLVACISVVIHSLVS